MKNSSSSLRLTSILMIIAIPVSMIAMSLAIAIMSGGLALHPGLIGFLILGFFVSAITYIVPAAASLVAAILGLIFWRKPNRAYICCIAGILLLVREVIAIITLLHTGRESLDLSFGFASFFIINLPISVCYTIAAFRLRKLSKQANVASETE